MELREEIDGLTSFQGGPFRIYFCWHRSAKPWWQGLTRRLPKSRFPVRSAWERWFQFQTTDRTPLSSF